MLFKIEKKEESEEQIILKIAITDTGIGIRKEDMSKLFADFERFDYKENKHVEGTGLGLSITAKMVNLMKGSIEVESVYGKGSTFTVYIPQKIADYSQIGNFEEKFHNYVQSLKSYKESFRAPDAHILVVDDNEMNLFVVEKLLKKTDINVTCCDSGAKCLEFVKKEKFDLILLDHMMPGMDGIETMKQMKAMEDNMCKGMPVIALTANAILGVRDMYISEGFDDYLSKPVDVSALEATLKKYIAEEKIIVDEVKDTAVKEDTEVVAEAVESPEKETAAKTTETKGEERYIDISTGMLYCANSMEMYREFLNMFCGMLSDKKERIERYYNAGDLAGYGVEVHSLKSTSLSIGGQKVSELAKELEMAAKAGDASFVKEHHDEMMKVYEATVAEGYDILAGKKD